MNVRPDYFEKCMFLSAIYQSQKAAPKKQSLLKKGPLFPEQIATDNGDIRPQSTTENIYINSNNMMTS